MSYLVGLVHDIRASNRPRELMLARLADAQHGVVARWQLVELGFKRGAIAYRLSIGRLHRVHEGVYAVGYSKLTQRGHFMAAVLACGKGALLSHRSNAALRSLFPDARRVIDVTAPGRSRPGTTGIVVHQPRTIHPDDIDVYDGIPCTSVARLLLDMAETSHPRQLASAFEAAERERVLDMRKVHELMQRSRGRAGLKPLNALLAQFEEPPPHERSKLERRFFTLCKRAGLPLPAVNAWVGEYEVDMLWREQKVIVELDSWSFHGSRQAFERDRARDVRLQLMEHKVLRFTWRRLANEPEVLLADVREAIERAASVAA